MSGRSRSIIDKASKKLIGRFLNTHPTAIPQKNFSGHIFHAPKYGIIYYAIPKVANTSLKWMMFDLIRQELPPWLIKRFDNSNDVQPMVRDREVFDFLISEGYILKKSQAAKVNSKVSFCVVRHPVDRLISCWRDKIREPDFSDTSFSNGVHKGFFKYGKLFFGGMCLNEFAKAVAKIPNEKANPHFRDQVDFVQLTQNKVLVDKVCRLEELDEGMKGVFQKAGIAQTSMKKKNSQNKRKDSGQLSDEFIETVESRFERDFIVFGYDSYNKKGGFE